MTEPTSDAPTVAGALDAGAPVPARGLWRELRDAIRGTGADYTKIPLRRAVFLLAVPMVLELVLESTFAVVDIFFVATADAPSLATKKMSTTANVDSSTSSSTIGTASRNTARRSGIFV